MDKLMAWLPQHIPAMARAEHMVSIGHRGARVRRALPSFVRTRGGEYVLLPSRAALTLLAAGG